MIDVSNLKDALETLGFIAYGDICEKVREGIAENTDCIAKQCAYVFCRRRRIGTLRSTNLEGADSCN